MARKSRTPVVDIDADIAAVDEAQQHPGDGLPERTDTPADAYAAAGEPVTYVDASPVDGLPVNAGDGTIENRDWIDGATKPVTDSEDAPESDPTARSGAIDPDGESDTASAEMDALRGVQSADATATDSDGNPIPVTVIDDDGSGVFDYDSLSPESRAVLEDAAGEIRRRAGRVVDDVFEIGKALARVQEIVREGQWQRWLRTEFDWSMRTAYNFIAVFHRFDGTTRQSFANMTLSAVYALASPTVPKDVVDDMIQKSRQVRITRDDVAKALRAWRRKHGEQVAMPGEFAGIEGVPTFVDLMALPEGVEQPDEASDEDTKEAKPQRSKEEKCAKMLAAAHWIIECDPAGVVAAMDDIQRHSMGDLLLWFAELAKYLPSASEADIPASETTTATSALDAAYQAGDL